jgi:hypothetical protein
MPTETGLKPPRPLAKAREADLNTFNVAAQHPSTDIAASGFTALRQIALDAEFGDYWCWAGE